MFFDVSDVTSIVSHFEINWETGEFIYIERTELEENEHLQFPDIDSQLLISKMKDTTSTLYGPKRYIELDKEEIIDIEKAVKNSGY